MYLSVRGEERGGIPCSRFRGSIADEVVSGREFPGANEGVGFGERGRVSCWWTKGQIEGWGRGS